MTASLPISLFAAITVGSIAGAFVVAGTVNLQDASPGTVQTGHTNITGYSLAGRFGANVSPSLARIQVDENGALQGLRAETISGVSVYGKNSATAGLGAGGYFTSNSIGGRAVVGDALSTTGSTVGGLFYNRSSGGGVAVWGRAIGTGDAVGVYADTTSSAGTALSATHTSGNGLISGTATDSLATQGAFPRHAYGSTPAAMVPIAYGYVSSAGTKVSGTDNWAVTYDAGNARYAITIDDETYFFSSYTTVVTRGGSIGFIRTSSASGALLVFQTSTLGIAMQEEFQFAVFKSDPAIMVAGERVKAPRHGFADDSVWAAKRPKDYAKYFADRTKQEQLPAPVVTKLKDTYAEIRP